MSKNDPRARRIAAERRISNKRRAAALSELRNLARA